MPMPFKSQLSKDYLPAQLTHQVYPNIIPENATVDTISVGALLIVYNWPVNSERYKPVAKFVDKFFANGAKFLAKPRHPKWHELVLAAEVPGWTRFGESQKLVDQMRVASDEKLKSDFQQFLRDSSARTGAPPPTGADRDALFQKFKSWQQPPWLR